MANNRELSQFGSFVEVSNSTVGITTNLNVSGIISATNGFVGTITGNADTATALETPRTFEITGDVVASAISFDGTGNVSLAATIQPNSVALGDDTTGNYVASITNGNYLTGGDSGSESAALTLGVDATSANTASKVVARDGSGNFSAGTITATFDGNLTGDVTGNADTASALETARTFEITGDVVGSPISFDGTGNVSIAATIQPNSVALGDDTTGNYVATISGTTSEIEVSGSGSENASVTIGLPDNVVVSGIVTATTFDGSLATSNLSGTITNAQLAGSISNDKLANSSVSFGGVTVSLGDTDSTPAFDLQDATGLPISTGVSGLGANVATFLATPSSSNLASAVTGETGSGALVFATSPALTTPTLGAASATSINASGIVTATRFVSTQATGTAPFTVSSTTVVTNLNADTVDGIQASSFLRSDTNDDFTGTLWGNNVGGTYLNLRGGGNSNTLLMRVSAAEASEDISANLASDYGFNIRYRGDLSGVENALQIDADNQNGTAIETLRIKQDGVVYFGPNPYVGSDRILTTAETSYNVGTDAGISTTRTTVATTSATTIESFAIATYRSARVQVQITQGTDYQTSDVLIIHDGSTASVIEYASIATDDYLGTFTGAVSGGNCLLQINMSSSSSATVKVLSQRITV